MWISSEKNKSELIQQQHQNVFNEINDRHLKPLKCWDKIMIADEKTIWWFWSDLLNVSLSPGVSDQQFFIIFIIIIVKHNEGSLSMLSVFGSN